VHEYALKGEFVFPKRPSIVERGSGDGQLLLKILKVGNRNGPVHREFALKRRLFYR